MNAEEMKQRTRVFSLRVVKLAAALPNDRIGDVFARQLVRCSTSVAANYRAACMGESGAEFVAKLGTVQEEVDETVFWIEMAADADLIKPHLVEGLLAEGCEILAVIVACRKTDKVRPVAKAKKVTPEKSPAKPKKSDSEAKRAAKKKSSATRAPKPKKPPK